MAEIVDRQLLHYIETRHIYITTDKGYIFLKRTDNLDNIIEAFSCQIGFVESLDGKSYRLRSRAGTPKEQGHLCL